MMKNGSIAGNSRNKHEGSVFMKFLHNDAGEAVNFEQIFYERMLPHEMAGLREFVPTYINTTSTEEGNFLCLQSVHNAVKLAQMDVKVRLPHVAKPHDRPSVAHLLGCYIHGVESKEVTYRNNVNAYKGCDVPIDHFHMTASTFFSQMGARNRSASLALIDRVWRLIRALQAIKGYIFHSASLLFTYDEESTQSPPTCHFIDFRRLQRVPDSTECDEVLIKSLRHVLLIMRTVWDKPVPTVYLIRHGERYDYTDKDWAPNNTHPHDAPLSQIGYSQALDVVDRLIHCNPHIIASAPFQRAIQSAEPLARCHRKKISVEPGFCEYMCNKTRSKMPEFVSSIQTISPWVDVAYKRKWEKNELETWEDVFVRTNHTITKLLEECENNGDLFIFSHRSTLQTCVSALMPNCRPEETMLEYGGLAQFVKDVDGQWICQSWNELGFLRNKIKSPSSNPYRHIEGYYEDLSWGKYESTASAALKAAAGKTTAAALAALQGHNAVVACENGNGNHAGHRAASANNNANNANNNSSSSSSSSSFTSALQPCLRGACGFPGLRGRRLSAR
eukprot:gnl/Hemi2/24520_TR8249_c0_g1_i1.p1 gnl/Hemi2/24520_TR8249_c0_g1~~gnl/Hemi2/24520_TR8249_c0_g1_i1.p1  ORF type:complete len:560 (+),score=170.08 gnl/Hemi2/24520_TR8249_c0_g1_i1:443-2122(+)